MEMCLFSIAAGGRRRGFLGVHSYGFDWTDLALLLAPSSDLAVDRGRVSNVLRITR
jgi:hypothetical protein